MKLEALESKGNQAARRTNDSSDQLIVPHWPVGHGRTVRRRAAAAPRVAWAAGRAGRRRRSVSGRFCTCSTASAKSGNSKGTFGPLFGSVPTTCIYPRTAANAGGGRGGGDWIQRAVPWREQILERREREVVACVEVGGGRRWKWRELDDEVKCRPDLYCREAE